MGGPRRLSTGIGGKQEVSVGKRRRRELFFHERRGGRRKEASQGGMRGRGGKGGKDLSTFLLSSYSSPCEGGRKGLDVHEEKKRGEGGGIGTSLTITFIHLFEERGEKDSKSERELRRGKKREEKKNTFISSKHFLEREKK